MLKEMSIYVSFLSTLSLRRATLCFLLFFLIKFISIHALLAESDTNPKDCKKHIQISIHALLAESDELASHSRR